MHGWKKHNQFAAAGAEEETYIIQDADQLIQLAQEVLEGNDYSGACFKLDKDIDVSGEPWMPIGNNYNRFNGTFDGGFHSISGLKLGSLGQEFGLFGVLDTQAVVSNLALTGCEIELKYENSRAGALAGVSFGGIKNCFCQLRVAIAQDGEGFTAGGITGVNQNPGLIKGCFCRGVFTDKGALHAVCFGGIAGKNMSQEGGVRGCYTDTAVTLSRTDCTAGGVVGENVYSGSVLKSCYATGTIAGTGKGLAAVSGINKGKLQSCFAVQGVSKQVETDGVLKSLLEMHEDAFRDSLEDAAHALKFCNSVACSYGFPHKVAPLPEEAAQSPAAFRNLFVWDQDIPLESLQGEGSREAPYEISDSKLLAHIGSHETVCVKMTTDISFSQGGPEKTELRIKRFSGLLDGGGKQVDASDAILSGEGLVDTLLKGGELKDIQVKYGSVELGGVFSGLAADNQGTVSGCTVLGSLKAQEKIFGLARKNSGSIKSCVCRADLVVSVSGKEGQAAGLTGENTGSVSDCDCSGKTTVRLTEEGAAVNLIAGGSGPVEIESNGKKILCR